MNIFRCVAKKYYQDDHKLSLTVPYEQGIQYRDGSCKIGIDIWRSLDKSDTPSYSFITYADLETVKEDYYLVTKNNKVLFS